MSFEIKGERELQRVLKNIVRNATEQAAQALRIEAEEIMTDSKRNYVPVAPDGGTLRASGKVGDVETKGLGRFRRLEVTMGFGGPAAAYAEAIHEHPSGASPPSWKGKTLNFHLGGKVGTKYLERPLMAAAPRVGRNIAAQIDLRP